MNYFILLFLSLIGQAFTQYYKSEILKKTYKVPQSGNSTIQNHTQASIDLLKRVLPKHYDQFQVVIIEYQDQNELFLYYSYNDKVVLQANNPVNIASALNHYLKYVCNVTDTWHGNNFETLPAILPKTFNRTFKNKNTQYTYYINVCTVSYSFVWWNWTRWEHHLDWMAMKGINMPLAFIGQELAWVELYQQLGINITSLQDNYLSGPAFLAWQRMGNIKKFGGPLTMNWIQSQYELGLNIISRMRELGMKTVLPAFSGHVPDEIQQIFPNASISKSQNWNGFNSTYSGNSFVEPSDPLFAQIGNQFIDIIIKLFGTDHLYNGDQFNEMSPKSKDPSYLKSAGEAMIQAMNQSDPNAVWIMQGWLFIDDTFWTQDAVKAYLSGIPDENLIILDLWSDVSPVYNTTNSYFGKQFVWNMLHNFGGNFGMYGRVQIVLNQPFQAMKQNKNMVGMGITMEGINQNYYLYELMLENQWRDPSNLSLDQITSDFVTSRYGQYENNTQQAWINLINDLYNFKDPKGRIPVSLVVQSPKFGIVENRQYQFCQLVQAWNQLLIPQSLFGNITTYKYDLIDTSREVLVNIYTLFYQEFQIAYRSRNLTQLQDIGNSMVNLILDMDALVQTSTFFSLGVWIDQAVALASNDEEIKSYKYNAINQITLWGPQGQISDYAAKQWGGLLKYYYTQRWDLFIQTVIQDIQNKQEFDQATFDKQLLAWEIEFQNQDNNYVYVEGDTLTIVNQIVEKYGKIVNDKCSQNQNKSINFEIEQTKKFLSE